MFKIFIRLKSKLVIRNSISTPKKNVMRDLNKETKALFGAVKTKNNTIENKKIENPESIASEIYWLTKHKSVKLEENRNKNKIIHENNVIEYTNTSPSEILWMTQKKTEIISKMENSRSTLKKSKTEVKSEIHKAFRNNCMISPAAPLPLPANFGMIKNPLIKNIPFSSEELELIPKSPLLYSKSNLNKVSVLDGKNVPSVGKILQATMSDSARNALMKWKIMKINELGETGFSDLQKSYLQNGSLFHSTIEKYLTTHIVPDTTSHIYDTWRSVDPFLHQISDTPLVERAISHPYLKYKGIVDCVASVNNELCIIEWKKSDRRKADLFSTYDAPVQLCAYLGAINANPDLNLKIKKGIVVIAYTNGDPADTYTLDLVNLHKFWKMWVLRVQEYWIRQRDGTMPEPI